MENEGKQIFVSLFVANFCTTTYKGRRKVNRSMKQRLCDDQSLIIEKTSTSYTVSCCLSSLLLRKVLTVVVNNSNNINDQTNRDRCGRVSDTSQNLDFYMCVSDTNQNLDFQRHIPWYIYIYMSSVS
jgi:hypothetical protein